MSIMVRLAVIAAAVLFFSNIAVAQFLPEDQIPLEIQNQIIADVVAEHGHLDMAALETAFRDWLLSQPLPDADGQMLDAGTCSNCSPPTDGEDLQFPPVRDVQIVTREGRIRPSFKVRWRRPVRLPREIRDLYELDSYEVFLTRDDGVFEHHEITKELRADGTERLPRRIRFRRRDPGVYTVHVRPVYVEVEQTEAASGGPTAGSALAGSTEKTSGPVTRGGLSGGKGPWGGGGGAPLDPAVDDVEVALPNDTALRRCVLANNYTLDTILDQITYLYCPYDGVVADLIDNTEMSVLSDFINLQTFNISDHNVTDISALQSLDFLQHLNISGNQGVNLVPLADMDALQFLFLERLNLPNLPVLHSLVNLSTYSLTDNNLGNANYTCSTATPTPVGFLNVDDNNLDSNDLNLLSRFSIGTLNISDNSIISLSALNNCAGLLDVYSLDISHNSLAFAASHFDLSSYEYFSLNLSNTSLAVLPDKLPKICGGELILESNPSMKSLSNDGSNLPAVSPNVIRWTGTDALACPDHDMIDAWYRTHGPGQNNGCNTLGIPNEYVRPASCDPGQVDDFSVNRNATNHAHYLQWDGLLLESQFRDFTYEIQRRQAGFILPEGQPYVIDSDLPSAVISNLDFDRAYEFRIRRCLDGVCSDYDNNWVEGDYPLTKPVGVNLTWTDPVAGDYQLRWSYPLNYFNSTGGRPTSFEVELNGQTLDSELVLFHLASWQSNQTFSESGVITIKACQGGVPGNPDVCGPPATISIDAEPELDALIDMPSSVVLSDPLTTSDFSIAIGANVQQLQADEIDYFEVIETGADATNLFTYFHDISDARDQGSHSIDLRRISSGDYFVDVRACRRNRLSDADTCSDVVRSNMVEVSDDITPTEYASINDSLCWDHNSAGDGVTLSWSYDPPNINGQDFLVPQRYRLTDAFGISNPSTFDLAAPALYPWTVDHTTSGSPLPAASGWTIEACDNGLSHCQQVGSIVADTTTTVRQCMSMPPPSSPDPLSGSSGGPSDLNPGVWVNLEELPRQGFTFYWASHLRHETTHEDYGNTYDLYMYWQTYQYINSTYTPIWLYAKLRVDPDDANVFNGGLYEPSMDLSQTHDREVGFFSVTFDETNSSQAIIELNVQLPGDLLTSNGTQTYTIDQISTETQVFPIAGTDNTTDYNNGIWQHSGGGPDYKIISWQYNYFEGQVMLSFDSNGRPIWLNGTLDCRDSGSDCTPTNVPGTQRHPITDGATLNYVTIEQGLPPFNPTADEQNQVVSVGVGTLERSLPENINDSDPAALSFNGLLSASLFDTSGAQFRSFNMNTGGNGHTLNKQANYHGIRYWVDGEEDAEVCNMTNGECEVLLSWFSDDDFFNTSEPSVIPFYTLNGGTLQRLDGELCNAGDPDPLEDPAASFAVDNYLCLIRQPGEYRFYLRNRIGTTEQNTIARSAGTLVVDGGNNVSNPPLTTIFDSQTPHAPTVPAPDPESEAFGHTQGSFVVDSNGAANYTVPIMTAPASGGLAPSVALSYNSQNGYGPMGKGWSVAGYSVISRCPQTFEQDGPTTVQNNIEYVPGVTFTDSDRFCLDGQRLMLVNTTDTYGADGVFYRSELDSITAVKSVGNYGGGPQCFEVYRPDGSKEFYGDCLTGSNEDDSALIKLNLSTDDRAYAWARASIEDNSGNYIRYEYQQRPEESNEVAIYIDKIHYTGNRINNQDPYAVIEFGYTTKSVTEQRISALPDPRFSFDDGSFSHLSSTLKMVDDQRISTVTSTVDGLMLRQYQLSYTSSQGRQYLSEIKECNGSTCYDPTRFTWSGQANSIPAINTNTTPSFELDDEIMGGIDARPLTTSTADLNGDGREDLLITYRNTNGVRINKQALSIGDGSFVVSDLPIAGSDINPLAGFDFNADGFTRIEDGEVIGSKHAMSDLNGDGLIDRIDRSGDDLLEFIYNTTSPGDTTAQFAAPTTAMVTLNFDLTGEGSPIGDPELERVVSVVDINQDGIGEIIVALMQEFCEGDGCDSMGAPLNDYSIPQPLKLAAASPSLLSGGNPCADPLDSCITTAGGTGIAWLREDANGVPYYEINELGGQPVAGSFYTDFEGDGLQELCGAFNQTAPTGNHVICEGALFNQAFQPDDLEDGSSFVFQDIDNDGDQDLLTTDNDGSNHTWFVHYANWDNGQLSFSSSAVDTGLIAGRVDSNPEESDIRVFMDYSGDGVLDYVFIEYDGNDGFNVFSSSGHNELNPTQYDYLITDIHNGRGGSATTTDGEHWSIEYLPMTDAAVYTRDNNAINAWFGSGKTAVYDMITSMPVVANVKHDMPAWDLASDDINSALQYEGNWADETRYHYRGLKMQAGGLGVLGFRQVDSFDVDRGLLSQTRYRQDFPYIGRAYESETWLVLGSTDPWSINESPTYNPNLPCWAGGDACLPVVPVDNACVTDNGYQCSADTSMNTPGVARLIEHNQMHYAELSSVPGNSAITFAHATHTLTQSFDLNDGQLLGRTVTVSDYNESASAFYGNQTDSTVYAYQGLNSGSAWLSKVTTHQIYDATAALINLSNGQWITNRIDNRDMQYQRPGEASRSYYYYYDYDARGRLTQELKQDTPTAAQITLSTGYSNFDVFGNARQVTVSGTDITDDRISEFTFDSRGRYLQQRLQTINNTDLLLLNIQTRNRYGEPLVSVNQQGVQSTVAYDVMGKAYYSHTSTGQWQQTLYSRNTSCYNGSAYAMSVTSPGPDQTTCFDALGRTLMVSTISLDGQASQVVNQYDIDGRVLAQSRPNFSVPGNTINGHWTKTIYDELDRPMQMRVPDGGISHYSYPGLDVVYTNAEGYTRTERSNILGERTGYTDYPTAPGGTGPDVSIAFDAKGNVRQITGPMGDTGSYNISMTYNRFDYLTQTNDPSRGGAWGYQTNALGEQTCVIDPKDQATRLTYDSFARVTMRHFYTNAVASSCSGILAGMQQWSYDNTDNINGSGSGSSGQMTHNVSTGESMDYVYDNLGRLVTTTTTIDSQLFTQDHRYDLHSRPLYQYDASGRGVSYGYNSHGYLITTTDLGTLRTYQTIEQLNPWGNIAQSSYGSGQQMNRSYDDLGRVVSILTAQVGTNPVQDLSYTYDLLGNLKTRDDDGTSGMPFSETFFYDGLNRLTDVQLTVPGQANIDTLDITYDLSGRIMQKDDVTYSYNNNQVMHGMTGMSDGYTAIYDANGNQEQSGNRDSTYTVFNKPSRIENPQAIVEFDYGANLNRFRRIDRFADGTAQRETLYVGNVEIITDNPDGQNPTTTYKRYIGDAVIVTESDTNHRVEYTHKDHLGSLHAITDVNGNLVSQLSFGAFGERREHLNPQMTTTINPAENTTTRGYTGHEHVDSLKLIHMNARTYDASIGQMMQADSVIPDMNNSQSLNRFAYVYNNPLSYTDPTGNTPTQRYANARVQLARIRDAARSGDKKAVDQLGAIQQYARTVRGIKQEFQGDSRSTQIALDVADGLLSNNFESGIGRKDSAEDEADVTNTGWDISAEQYESLSKLAKEGRRAEYYVALYEMTGSTLAIQMAQVSSNSGFLGGVAWEANERIKEDFEAIYPGDIQDFSTMVFLNDFNQIQANGDGGYRVPDDLQMIEATVDLWQSVGLGDVAPPQVMRDQIRYGLTAGAAVSTFRVPQAMGYVGAATFNETYRDRVGTYREDFLRDHPNANTSYTQDGRFMIITGARLSREVNAHPTKDIVVYPTFQ